ncbi:MAG: Uma2 family endonuclease [Acidobacteriota bacterium]|nr:Uma2 family endonuclease [Acidobacteriota bacterium]
MTTATATNYLEIIEQLTPEVPVIFRDVRWDEYVQLLEDLGERPCIRLSYDRGTLEIMSTSSLHEYYGLALHDLIRQVTRRLGIRIRAFGRATMKKSRTMVGKEPDGCYYVKSLTLIGKKKQIDFEHAPSPDIAVEIDLSTNTINKLPLYQRLGVAEVWIYDGYEMTIHRLSAQGYEAVEQSVELPCFTSALLTDFLNASQDAEDDEQLLQDYVGLVLQSAPSSAE